MKKFDECDENNKCNKEIVINNNIKCGDCDKERATGLAAFGYVFDKRDAGQVIASGSNVLFNNNGPLKDITHSITIDTDSILVNQAGIYNISFSVYTQISGGSAVQNWAVDVNGVVASLFQAAGQNMSASTSLSLQAGDIITIENFGAPTTAPVTLRNGLTGAYVLIYKVN
jgi:hypothetical protein